MKEIIVGFENGSILDFVTLGEKTEEVVRCKDCVNACGRWGERGAIYCLVHEEPVTNEDFCSWAKPKE